MYTFDQKFAFRQINGSKQFQHTEMYKVTEIILIVFGIAHSAVLVQNVGYQQL